MENQHAERITLKVDKNGREFIFSMPDQTPIGEAWDAAYMVLLHLVELAKKANDSVRPPLESLESLEVKPEASWQEEANS